MNKDHKMTELILVGIIGLLVGAGATFGIIAGTQPKGGGDEVASAQIEVQKQLTDTDLLKEPCSESFINLHSDLLCRELFCRMQQRGIDAKTGATDCEQIGNIANTLEIKKACENLAELEERRQCEELFFKRK